MTGRIYDTTEGNPLRLTNQIYYSNGRDPDQVKLQHSVTENLANFAVIGE